MGEKKYKKDLFRTGFEKTKHKEVESLREKKSNKNLKKKKQIEYNNPIVKHVIVFPRISKKKIQ